MAKKSVGGTEVLDREQFHQNGNSARTVLVDPAALTLPGETMIVDTSLHLTMPELTCFPGYATTNIDFNATHRQAAAAKVLWSSLAEAGVRVGTSRSHHPEGKVVDGVSDGVRWLLDQLADHIELSTGKDLLKDFDLAF